MDSFSPSMFGGLKNAAAKKADTGAAIIDLSLRSSDIPPAEIIRKTLSESSMKENMYGYTLGGLDQFNEAVAYYYLRRSNVVLDSQSKILQTMGSQEWLVHIPFAFCDERDIVLTTNPAYVAYDTGVKLAGPVPYSLPLIAVYIFLPHFH